MYRGINYWNGQITHDMVKVISNSGREFLTFPDLPVNLYTSFAHTAQKHPERTAVTDDDGKVWTYETLLDRTHRTASWLLSSLHVKKGDHVALMLYNSIEFCITFLALNQIGAVVIPLPTKFRREEVCSLLQKSDANFLISHTDFEDYFQEENRTLRKIYIASAASFANAQEYPIDKDALEKAQALVAPDDQALLMFTSGTTSKSKGVVICNYNIMHAIVSYERTLGISETDRAILPIPIYLITGLIAVFGLMMHVGGSVYLNKFFDGKRVLSDIRKYQITFIHASPTVFTLLLKEGHNFPHLPSLRMAACGSSNMAPGKIRALRTWLTACEFRTIYGLTETTSPATVFPTDANASPHIGSSGVPIPGLDFKILREDGREALSGESGEIFIHGTNITPTYYKVGSSITDGWLSTGDIGYFNQEGYLYIIDRKKDMINRGGEKICSFDIENELSEIDGIEDCAVVGIPDELYGEIPAAVIKLSSGSCLDEVGIKTHLKSKIASYKIPSRILFLDHIPVTENLKINKKKIRMMFK